ncbi:hypothetical protein C8R47DRAFT_1230063 [Mycena vitilis]|nr:hypothetical protein C8R47DRAFT_1230063 [Mycena vitilis]
MAASSHPQLPMIYDPYSNYYTYPPVSVTGIPSSTMEHLPSPSLDPHPSSTTVSLSALLNPIPEDRGQAATPAHEHPLARYQLFAQQWLPRALPTGFHYASPYHPAPDVRLSRTRIYGEDIYADPIRVNVESTMIFVEDQILVFTPGLCSPKGGATAVLCGLGLAVCEKIFQIMRRCFVEGFVHLHLFKHGGLHMCFECPCDVAHREYVFLDSIRGLAAVDSWVVDVLLASGEQIDRETLPRPDIDGDFYDLILRS